MTLLDQNRKYYVFERKAQLGFVSHASSKIYDEKGNQIGFLIGEGTFRKQISLIDANYKVFLTIKKSALDPKYDYTLFDANKNVLGFVKRKYNKYSDEYDGSMVDKNKNTILIGQGPFKEGEYGIGDKNKKIVATFSFEEVQGWKNKLLGTDLGKLEILNFDFNRLLLLGFFISMFSSFYDITSKGERAE